MLLNPQEEYPLWLATDKHHILSNPLEGPVATPTDLKH